MGILEENVIAHRIPRIQDSLEDPKTGTPQNDPITTLGQARVKLGQGLGFSV